MYTIIDVRVVRLIIWDYMDVILIAISEIILLLYHIDIDCENFDYS